MRSCSFAFTATAGFTTIPQSRFAMAGSSGHTIFCHNRTMRIEGKLDRMGRQFWRTPPYERIMAKTARVGECLEYTGYRNKAGYGWVAVGRDGPRHAHRLIWEYHNPDQVRPDEIMHTCDNPPCVEISHLLAGTHAENMADMARKKRNKGARGEKNPNWKLPEEQVREIREQRKLGVTCQVLAARFGVSDGYISRLARGLNRPYDGW